MPGWYGVAWVKWLQRIELHDRRFLSRFMGRDYVTIRGKQQGEIHHLVRNLGGQVESQVDRRTGDSEERWQRPGHGCSLERRDTP